MQKQRWYFFFSLVLVGIFCVGAYALAASNADVVKLKNPIADGNIQQILGRVVRQGFTILGSITFLVFVYGGFLWLTSGGNSDKVSKGTSVMTWAVVGIFIIFASYAILNTVIGGLTGNVAPTTGGPDFSSTQSFSCYCEVVGKPGLTGLSGVDTTQCNSIIAQLEQNGPFDLAPHGTLNQCQAGQ